MRKIFSILVTFFIVLVMLSGCGTSKTKSPKDDSLSRIKEKGKIIVGLDDNFPPMGFRDKNNEIAGFDIDLAKEAAKRMGLNVEFKPVEWDGIILSLKNKDIDVIWNGLTITDKRKEAIGFTDAYLKNKQIIVVLSGSDIKTKKDLGGKIVGVQMGSSSEEALESDKETLKTLKQVRKYSNNTEALLDLKSGRLQAVVVDEVVGRYYISKMPNVYKILKEDFGAEEYGVGFRKEDKSFGQALDEALKAIKQDGTAEKLSKKWFGESIIEK
ncbi:cystine-binding periplasmic protein precursor [Clostridium tepidiprofundi DSM 19306]|uniref:Cystine-binding periplasmic protein n=1 Tax=Clostridium tepidiprofundi DSM 19306 TaxID=1121338 RepID=A0A151B3A9_9CLOT|nr:amino acid ABC transporter substrate-binding protein [Clostridium tepidiprofundi]KYH34280.1 cystine-binding periplasmic protein precursor [Clostridium tepidiprofundi DSM 19306]